MPVRTVRSRESTAVKLPKVRVRPLVSIAGGCAEDSEGREGADDFMCVTVDPRGFTAPSSSFHAWALPGGRDFWAGAPATVPGAGWGVGPGAVPAGLPVRTFPV